MNESRTDFSYQGVYHVIGPPGTGKTTFLRRQVQAVVERYSGTWAKHQYPTPVLVCSLTKAAASEVAGRNLPIPKRCVGTLHSHCFRAMDNPRVVGAGDIEVWNETSSFPISPAVFGNADDAKWDAKAEGLVGSDSGDRLIAALDLERHRMTAESTWPRELREFHEAWTEFKAERDCYDFTDLIAVALQLVPEPPGNPAVIMVDEAQDLSKLEYELVTGWSKHAQATIIVGDPWQSLYTWRGADPTIFHRDRVPDSHRRILSQSYRVPKAVVDVAAAWMKDHLHDYEPIEYKPRSQPIVDESDVPGVVETRRATIHDPEELIAEAMAHVDEGRSVMFQAACGYMLNTLIAHLRAQHIPYANPWRLHRADWNPLRTTARGVSITRRLKCLLRACHDAEEPAEWTWKDVKLWASVMKVKDTLKRGAKHHLERLGTPPDDRDTNGEAEGSGTHERNPMLIAFGDSSDRVPTVGELAQIFHDDAMETVAGIVNGDALSAEAAKWWYGRLLAAPKRSAGYGVGVVERRGSEAIMDTPRIYVGTIHSFKGAEADVVYVFPDLSRAGAKQWQAGKGDDRDSVVRLFYVAMTRARERLHVCSPSSNMTSPLRSEVDRCIKAAKRELARVSQEEPGQENQA